MKKTINYQLNQWEMTDRIQMADFNSDNQKIEAALHGLAGQVAEKADTSMVNSLTAQVGKKAELTALAAEETARKNAVRAEEAARINADSTLRSENCWVKLSDKTLTAAASSYSWSISHPEKYAELRCVFEAACTDTLSLNLQNGAEMRGLYNNTHASTLPFTSRQIVGAPAQGLWGVIRLNPMGGGFAIIRYEVGVLMDGDKFFYPSDQLMTVTQIYNMLNTVKLFSEAGTFSAGSRFMLYGLKK